MLDRHIRTALAVTRANGAPPLAVLLGMGPVWPTEAAVELRYSPDRPRPALPLGMPDVAMLADFALAAALRTRYAGGRSIPTASLTVQLSEPVAPADLRVRAWPGEPTDGVADARGELLSGGRVVGRALGSFVLRDTTPQARTLPWTRRWEAPSVDPVPAEELTGQERAVLGDLLRAARAPEGHRSWTERLLDLSGNGTGWQPSSAMVNRGGTVQGGVIFALAHAAALGAAGPAEGPLRMVSGHVAFAAPAGTGAPITPAASLAHATKRTRFARAELRQDERTIAIGDFVLRATR